jgi:hypothetical protein
MPMPAEGTKEYIDLVMETGGGAALPGFNYEAHIAATRNAVLSSRSSSSTTVWLLPPARSNQAVRGRI